MDFTHQTDAGTQKANMTSKKKQPKECTGLTAGKKRNTKMDGGYYRCGNCEQLFKDIGDDYWVECPYCHCQEGHKVAKEGIDFKIIKKGSKNGKNKK